MRVDSSPDNAGTGQHCQMVWVRQARRKGVTRVNQRLNAPQETATSSNLADVGWVATRTRTTTALPLSGLTDLGWVAARTRSTPVGWGTLRLGDVAGREAMVNACGVAVARLQGHSWAPTPSKGSRVNVGTIHAVPFPASSLLVGGKICRRSMPSGWGGGPVVVRARESRAHGEGVQRVRSTIVERGGRW